MRVYVCLGIREMIAVIQGWKGGTRNILLLQGTCITHEAIQCYFKVHLNQSQIYIADSRTNTKKKIFLKESVIDILRKGRIGFIKYALFKPHKKQEKKAEDRNTNRNSAKYTIGLNISPII